MTTEASTMSWGSHRQEKNSRGGVAREREAPPLQLTRSEDIGEGAETFLGPLAGPPTDNILRQLEGGDLQKQTRGHTLTLSQQSCLRALPMGEVQRHQDPSLALSRRVQRPLSMSLSRRPATPYSGIGSSTLRPLRKEGKREDELLQKTLSSRSSSRPPFLLMRQDRPVGISLFVLSKQDSNEDCPVKFQINANSVILA